MPLVTLTLAQPRAQPFKTAVLDAVHRSLIAAGVPEADRFQRVIEPAAQNLRIDPRYPDAATPRGDDFVLIEILWSVGRSVKVKRKLLADIVSSLQREPGIDPEHVMIVFQETAWENWSFAGGRMLHA
ncbi:MAG TPA: tautomerase family protein [Casimicrobiaceae bacterium]|nr:tautomerase family protein [Casimicrobiaceae bacterium]